MPRRSSPTCRYHAALRLTRPRHVIRQSGTEISCHALDLSQPPDALLAQVRSLAQAIASAHLFQAPPGRP